MENIWIIILVIAILLVGVFIQKNYDLFAVLPIGQYNAYPDETTCTFISNEDPITNRFSAYRNSGVWISIDTNNDRIKEKFGYRIKPSIIYTGGQKHEECDVLRGAILLVEDYNSYGDDIYYFYEIGSLFDDPGSINICSNTGGDYSKFSLNYGSASNAIITCDARICPVTSGTECTTCAITSDVLNNWRVGNCDMILALNCGSNLKNIPDEYSKLVQGTDGVYYCEVNNPMTIQISEKSTQGLMAEMLVSWSGGEDPILLEIDWGDSQLSSFERYGIDLRLNHGYPTTGDYTTSVCVYDFPGSSNYICQSAIFSITCIPADTNCNNIVDRTELMAHITKWLNNQVTRQDLMSTIVAWLSS